MWSVSDLLTCSTRKACLSTPQAGSIFEPLGYEPLARVYIYLTQPPGAGVHKLVRHARRHHHDLATPCLDDFVARRESCGALLHHEDLLIGVPVQPRAAPRACLHHDERDAGAVSESLELVGVLAPRRVGHVDDARHAPPPRLALSPAWTHRETLRSSQPANRPGPEPHCRGG